MSSSKDPHGDLDTAVMSLWGVIEMMSTVITTHFNEPGTRDVGEEIACGIYIVSRGAMDKLAAAQKAVEEKDRQLDKTIKELTAKLTAAETRIATLTAAK